MLKHYYLNAVRNLWRNKVTTLINIVGLAIGISAAFIIYLIVQYDFSYDRFHYHEERIYHLVTHSLMNGQSFPNAGVPAPLPEVIRREVPGLEETSTFFIYFGASNVTIPAIARGGHPAHVKNHGGVVFADDHYFNLFSYKWLAGTPGGILRTPGQVVLTEKRAEMYFPGLPLNQIPGRAIIYDDSVKVFVTGIVKNLEQPSDLYFSDFISYTTLTNTSLKKSWFNGWNNLTSQQQCFVRLSPASTPAGITRAIAEVRHKYDPNDDLPGAKPQELLQPLKDMHFDGVYNFGGGVASKPALYGLLLAAFFLLLLACINYINLSTAQASQRAKEIGIRKTMGSSRGQLMIQFLGETFCITFCAALLSVILTPFLVKVFHEFIPRDMTFNPLKQFHIIGFLLALTVGVTFLSGLYPALILSGLKPVLILRNQLFSGSQVTRKAWLRKILTVSQFIIAQVFVLATMLVAKQINFSLHKDLGYRKDAIIFFSVYQRDSRLAGNRFALLNEIDALPGVERASLGSEPPASTSSGSMGMDLTDGARPITVQAQLKSGDTSYIRVYDLKLLAGRNLEESDSAKGYIINQTLARLLEFRKPEDALGKHLDGHPIVGVVRDFNQASLHTPILPLVIYGEKGYTIHVALQRENEDGTAWKKTIGVIGAAYKKLYPDNVFNYQFYDESIAAFYKTEQDTASLLRWATGLAILISCLGLLGLVLFITRTRTKEIGVRKVLGASAFRIVVLLSADFMRLVILSFVIAAPIAWYVMHRWLEDFTDRTPISWWVFALGGLVIVFAALFTLSFQTIRAARANPVKSLRAE